MNFKELWGLEKGDDTQNKSEDTQRLVGDLWGGGKEEKAGGCV